MKLMIADQLSEAAAPPDGSIPQRGNHSYVVDVAHEGSARVSIHELSTADLGQQSGDEHRVGIVCDRAR
jgi:hypothetical protein